MLANSRLLKQNCRYLGLDGPVGSERTGVDASVAGALGTEHSAVDLADAAAGHRHLLKLVKQLLDVSVKRALDRMPRELERVRWCLWKDTCSLC